MNDTIEDDLVLIATTDAPVGQVSKALRALKNENFEIEEDESYETDDQVGYVLTRD